MFKKIQKTIWNNLRTDFVGQMASFSVLTGTFTVLATFLLIHQNVNNFLLDWGTNVRVSVYLEEGVKEWATKDIEENIEKSDLFSAVNFFSKKDAAERFRSRVGEIVPDLVSDLDFENPLPASFELQVKDGVRSGGAFDKIVSWAKVAKTLPGVEDVSYGQGWIENYAAVVRVFSTTSYIFIFVLLAGGAFVVGNSVRGSLMNRRDEIEILELIGATRSTIVIPYVVEGLLYGIFASLVGVIVVAVLFYWQSAQVMSELQFWSMKVSLTFLSGVRIFFVLFTGGAIGGLASYIWATKMNSGWAAAELRIK